MTLYKPVTKLESAHASNTGTYWLKSLQLKILMMLTFQIKRDIWMIFEQFSTKLHHLAARLKHNQKEKKWQEKKAHEHDYDGDDDNEDSSDNETATHKQRKIYY